MNYRQINQAVSPLQRIAGQKTAHRTPDFICDDIDRFEVKQTKGKMLNFSNQQIESFKDSDNIMVYKNGILINEFKWGDRNFSEFGIHNSTNIIKERLLRIPVKLDNRMVKLAEKGNRDMTAQILMMLEAETWRREKEAKSKE